MEGGLKNLKNMLLVNEQTIKQGQLIPASTNPKPNTINLNKHKVFDPLTASSTASSTLPPRMTKPAQSTKNNGPQTATNSFNRNNSFNGFGSAKNNTKPAVG